MKVFQMQWRFRVLYDCLVKEHTATFFEGKLFFTHLRKIMRCVSIRGISRRQACGSVAMGVYIYQN